MSQGMLTRREFGGLALGAMSTIALSSRAATRGAGRQKPDSTFGGVPIGVIAPFSFANEATDADSILAAMVGIGLSCVEMRADVVERFAGAPIAIRGRGPGNGPRAAGGGQRGAGSAARGGGRGTSDALRAWRQAAPLDRFVAFRTQYEAAGVGIYALRASLDATMSDAEYDYVFQATKALGANQVTMELPHDDDALTARIGAAARQHEIYVAYHAHTQGTARSWDTALSQSPFNAVQLDVGHFVAGTNESPVPFIETHHDRILSMHLKDRRRGDRGGEQVPMGEGDTPLVEILQLMRDSNYRIPSAIELSYPIPPGSTHVAEVKRCLEYCRAALLDRRGA